MLQSKKTNLQKILKVPATSVLVLILVYHSFKDCRLCLKLSKQRLQSDSDSLNIWIRLQVTSCITKEHIQFYTTMDIKSRWYSMATGLGNIVVLAGGIRHIQPKIEARSRSNKNYTRLWHLALRWKEKSLTQESRRAALTLSSLVAVPGAILTVLGWAAM